MPFSGRPLRTIGLILSPATSSATVSERVRSGPVAPPIASRPWQKPQCVAKSDSPALIWRAVLAGGAFGAFAAIVMTHPTERIEGRAHRRTARALSLLAGG